MTNKTFLKIFVAIGLLAMFLTLLGVKYVPRISAQSVAKANAVQAEKFAGSDYFERHPSTVARSVNYAVSDWIERHSSNYYSKSDWIERHPSVVHPANYYTGSDWIERH